MSEAKARRELNRIIGGIFLDRQKEGSYAPKRVTVGWPVFGAEEVTGALDSLLNIQISQGPKVREFEAAFARYMGRKFAVAVNSGSSANLIALAALVESGRVPKGSEVIVPAATFSAVASPIIQVGLVPVYVDVEPDTWNIDHSAIQKAITKKTRVIMPVHSFGNPARMSEIMLIAKKHKLLVLEDCCEAHGSSIGKKKAGAFGDVATLSFFVAHNITTGEGGMIFTDQESLYELLTSLREFGRLPLKTVQEKRFTYKDPVLGQYDTRYVFQRLGYNVRMTDIAAALGLAQLKKLDKLNKRRLQIVSAYQEGLRPYISDLQLPDVRPGTFHSFYGYPMVVRKDSKIKRRDLVQFLESKGIETRPFFAGSLPDQPAFRGQPGRISGALPVSRWLRDNSFFIGCHPALTERHIQIVLGAFQEFFKSRNVS